MKTFKIGDKVIKKSGKPFKSGEKEGIIKEFSINKMSPKQKECAVFEDGSVCNLDVLKKNETVN